MHLLSTCLLFGLTGLVSARCGTFEPDESIRALHRIVLDRESSKTGVTLEDSFAEVIPTYVHLIQENNTVEVTAKQVTDQMEVLNARYRDTGFSFKLMATNTTINPAWRKVAMGSAAEYEMKSTLRRGKYDALNLYFDTMARVPNAGELLGYAEFPKDKPSDRDYKLDGVVINPVSVPEGSGVPYNLGITAVHEVGHWLSLFHTFQPDEITRSGCIGQGDMVDDTPAEASPASGCPEGRNTCFDLFGEALDPIHNYMDYSDDACLNNFTKGQITRMRNMWVDLRKGK